MLIGRNLNREMSKKCTMNIDYHIQAGHEPTHNGYSLLSLHCYHPMKVGGMPYPPNPRTNAHLNSVVLQVGRNHDLVQLFNSPPLDSSTVGTPCLRDYTASEDMGDKYEQGEKLQTHTLTVEHTDTQSVIRADDAELAGLGYRSEFRREFSVSVVQSLASFT